MAFAPAVIALGFWLFFLFVLTHKEDVMDFRDSRPPLRLLGRAFADSERMRTIDYAWGLFLPLVGAVWFTIYAFFPGFVEGIDWPGNPAPR